jgi:hypothetical protein
MQHFNLQAFSVLSMRLLLLLPVRCPFRHSPLASKLDLRVLGGLPPLVALLQPQHLPELQEGAAYVLGTAASNNAKLVEALLQEQPELLQQLLQVGGQQQVWRAAGRHYIATHSVGCLMRCKPEHRGNYMCLCWAYLCTWMKVIPRCEVGSRSVT